jgi:small conductance mechanosensitive channel
MEEFASDVFGHIEKYYYGLVDVTPKIGLAIVAILISWFIARKAQDISGRKLKKRMHDPLLAIFISRLIKAALIVLGLLLVLRIVGLTGIATSLLAGAGISAFVVGFALKDIGENFLAGILLAFKRPFHIGETIESNGIKGKVISLNLRDTQILSGDKDIYLPNALLVKNPLINYSKKGFQAQTLVVGIECGANYERALEVIGLTLAQIEGILNDENKKSSVYVSGISLNSVDVTINYWVKTNSPISSELIRSNIIIKTLQALKEEGFNIPANVIEIKKYESDIYKNGQSEKLDGPIKIAKN